jgi:hypothetical protein
VGTVTDIGVEITLGPSESLGKAEESVAVAYSFLVSKCVGDAIPYTIYIELLRAVENAGQGLKICRAIVDTDLIKDASGIYD